MDMNALDPSGSDLRIPESPEVLAHADTPEPPSAPRGAFGRDRRADGCGVRGSGCSRRICTTKADGPASCGAATS